MKSCTNACMIQNSVITIKGVVVEWDNEDTQHSMHTEVKVALIPPISHSVDSKPELSCTVLTLLIKTNIHYMCMVMSG